MLARFATVLCAALLLWVTVPAHADWPQTGRVLCTACDPRNPDVIPDAAGGAFVLWIDARNGPDGTNDDLYVQRVTASGDLANGWLPGGQPVCVDPSEQYPSYRSLGPDGSGGALTAWTDFRNSDTSGPDIYAQRILADGAVAPGWPVNGAAVNTTVGYQTDPFVLGDGTGGAFITWSDYGTQDIYLQHLTVAGVPAPGWPVDGIPVCTDTSYQCCPQLAPDGQGGVFIVWADTRGAPADSIGQVYGQHVSGAGVLDSGWPANGMHLVSDRGLVGLVSDDAGGGYISCGTSDFRFYLVRFTGAGTTAPGWPAGGALVCAASEDRAGLRLVGDGVGGALLAWSDHRDFYDDDIFALRMQPDGTRAPGWPADGLRVTDNTGLDDFVDITSDGSGGLYLAWEQYYTVTGDYVVVQHLLADGSVAPGWPAGGLAMPNDAQTRSARITSDGAGGAIATWEWLGPINEGGIRAMRFATDGPVPVLVSLVSTEVESNRVRLTWYVPDGSSFAATVERRTETGEWSALGTIRPDGSGKLSYEDRSVAPGTLYGYRLSYPDGASMAYPAETWVSVPALRLALRGFTPNPSMGDPLVAFSLASAEPAVLELYDVTGRLALRREIGSLGAGAHTLRLEGADRLPAGVYTVRVWQGAQSASARAVVVR
jgi:hypothetical protein